MNRLTNYLDRLQKVCDRATPGKWEHQRIEHDSGEFSYEFNNKNRLISIYESNFEKPIKAKFDADFIAESRTAITKLLQIIRIYHEAVEFYNDKDLFEQGHGLSFEETAQKALQKAEELINE